MNRVERGGSRPGLSSAGFEPTDAIAPHVNTYSLLLESACLVNAVPVDMR